MTDSELRASLQQEPWLPGVIEHWLKTSYMTMTDIKEQLIHSLIGLEKMKSLKGCGELTSAERKFLTKYKEYL